MPVSTVAAGTTQHVKPVSQAKSIVVCVLQVLLASTVKTVGNLENSLEVFKRVLGIYSKAFALTFHKIPHQPCS